jgi:endogenous inhibitor of DNA gyrase (YacG/DUF329 family)
MAQTPKQKQPASRREATCPICGQPRVRAYQPFCSKRCADIDLHRWLGGVYAIPAVEDDEEPAERPPEH